MNRRQEPECTEIVGGLRCPFCGDEELSYEQLDASSGRDGTADQSEPTAMQRIGFYICCYCGEQLDFAPHHPVD